MLKYTFILILLLAGLIRHSALAQDAQFTQFYATSTFHNPAFAGSADRPRVSLDARNQWASLPGAYVTTTAAFDTYFKKASSGLGAYILYDQAGGDVMRSTSVMLQYAARVRLQKKWTLRAGGQLGTTYRNIDYSQLVFGDQFDDQGAVGSSSEPLGNDRRSTLFFDLGAGLLVHNQYSWLSFSALHLNRPEQNPNPGPSTRMPIKYTLAGGVKIPMGRDWRKERDIISVTPTAMLRRQGRFTQFDAGVYGQYYDVIGGIWYRGLPLINSRPNIYNNDALAFIIGYRFDDIQVAYSYDLTLSRLFSPSKGSHEISLTYVFNKRDYRIGGGLPCPEF